MDGAIARDHGVSARGLGSGRVIVYGSHCPGWPGPSVRLRTQPNDVRRNDAAPGMLFRLAHHRRAGTDIPQSYRGPQRPAPKSALGKDAWLRGTDSAEFRVRAP